jgi:hypothetical protein
MVMSANHQGAKSSTLARIRTLLPLPSVLAAIVFLSFWTSRDRGLREPEATVPAPTQTAPAPVVAEAPVEAPEEEPAEEPEEAAVEPPPKPPEPPPLDRAAVAKAEAALDEASRDRARAEARTDAARKGLEAAANQSALEAAKARKLAFRVRDPSAQIARASARGGFLKAERDKIKTEVASLRSLPLPKATSILSKNPVSRPAGGDEFHFELRRERVSFVNLDRLLELAKSDAQVRLRMADRNGMITSEVGPVEWFSLAYVLGRARPGIEELMERQSIRFDLRGWEVIPASERRGETYEEATHNPISRYSQTMKRLTPGRSVVTMWVYPDSFGLFRKLRDELNNLGFSVAGRPLPEGMTIRGSPMGSVSATQ